MQRHQILYLLIKTSTMKVNFSIDVATLLEKAAESTRATFILSEDDISVTRNGSMATVEINTDEEKAKAHFFITYGCICGIYGEYIAPDVDTNLFE